MMSKIKPEIAQVQTPADTTAQILFLRAKFNQNGRLLIIGRTKAIIIPNIANKVMYANIIERLISTDIPVRSRKKLANPSASTDPGI